MTAPYFAIRAGFLTGTLFVCTNGACNPSDLFEGNRTAGGVVWKTPDPPGQPEYSWGGIPVAGGGVVIFMQRPDVVAFRSSDGTELWRRRLVPQSAVITVKPLLKDGTLYVAIGDTLFAFEAASGTRVWAVSTGHDYGPCEGSIDETTVYVCSYDNYIAAYRRSDGSRVWERVATPGDLYQTWVMGTALSGDTLYAVVRRDAVKFGSERIGTVLGLDRRTGVDVWRFDGERGREGGAEGSPVVIGRIVIHNDYSGGSVRGIDRFSGVQSWRIRGEPGFFGPSGTPAASGDTAYIASGDGFVYAIHAPTGRVVWTFKGGEGSYLHVGVCGRRVYANNLGVDILDKLSGRRIDRVLASRERDLDYAISGFGTDGSLVFVAGPIATFAIPCG